MHACASNASTIWKADIFSIGTALRGCIEFTPFLLRTALQ